MNPTHHIDSALHEYELAKLKAFDVAKEALPQYLFFRDITNNQALKPITDYKEEATKYWPDSVDEYDFDFESERDYASLSFDFVRDPQKYIDDALKSRLEQQDRVKAHRERQRSVRINELKELLAQDGLDIEIKER